MTQEERDLYVERQTHYELEQMEERFQMLDNVEVEIYGEQGRMGEGDAAGLKRELGAKMQVRVRACVRAGVRACVCALPDCTRSRLRANSADRIRSHPSSSPPHFRTPCRLCRCSTASWTRRPS